MKTIVVTFFYIGFVGILSSALMLKISLYRNEEMTEKSKKIINIGMVIMAASILVDVICLIMLALLRG